MYTCSDTWAYSCGCMNNILSGSLQSSGNTVNVSADPQQNMHYVLMSTCVFEDSRSLTGHSCSRCSPSTRCFPCRQVLWLCLDSTRDAGHQTRLYADTFGFGRSIRRAVRQRACTGDVDTRMMSSVAKLLTGPCSLPGGQTRLWSVRFSTNWYTVDGMVPSFRGILYRSENVFCGYPVSCFGPLDCWWGQTQKQPRQSTVHFWPTMRRPLASGLHKVKETTHELLSGVYWELEHAVACDHSKRIELLRVLVTSVTALRVRDSIRY